MTEQEAKTKWCPFARAVVDDGHAYPTGNRFPKTPALQGECLCIGSACMAWRWKWTESRDDRMEEHRKPNGEGQGFCGLAGKP